MHQSVKTVRVKYLWYEANNVGGMDLQTMSTDVSVAGGAWRVTTPITGSGLPGPSLIFVSGRTVTWAIYTTIDNVTWTYEKSGSMNMVQ